MRVVVHAGMHKTGSSSIQETLFRNRFDGIGYAPWRHANHSALCVLLYHENPAIYHGFSAINTDPDQLARMQTRWRNALDEALDGDDDTLVISAEAISSTITLDDAAKTRFFEHLRQHTDDLELVLYVRPPAGFMQSAFQQRVRGSGLDRFVLENLWPNYRKRFETLLDLFGKDRTTLRVFDRSTLADGDVVVDFCNWLGVTVAPENIVRTNESLSLEALALLYTQRRLGHGLVSGFPKAMPANARFIKTLEGFGRGKVRFSRAALEPVFERNAEDLAWIEGHLGTPLNDLPDADDGTVISTEEDLFAIAEDQADALRAHIAQTLHAGIGAGRAAVAGDLDLLYLDAIAATVGNGPR